MNSTTTMKEIEIKMKKKNIAQVRIMRDGLGMKIYYKSKVFHNLFSSYSNKMTASSHWQDNRIGGYDTSAFVSDALFMSSTSPSSMNNEAEYCRKNMKFAIRGWGNDEMLLNPNFMTNIGIPNIAWLASKGADEGVLFNIKRPMSNRAFEMYVKQVGKFMKFVYEQFLRPDNRTISLSIEYETKKGSRITGNLIRPSIDLTDPLVEELV